MNCSTTRVMGTVGCFIYSVGVVSNTTGNASEEVLIKIYRAEDCEDRTMKERKCTQLRLHLQKQEKRLFFNITWNYISIQAKLNSMNIFFC